MALSDREKELLHFDERPSTRRFKKLPKHRLTDRHKHEAIATQKKIEQSFDLNEYEL
jgi:hypothetical protein